MDKSMYNKSSNFQDLKISQNSALCPEIVLRVPGIEGRPAPKCIKTTPIHIDPEYTNARSALFRAFKRHPDTQTQSDEGQTDEYTFICLAESRILSYNVQKGSKKIGFQNHQILDLGKLSFDKIEVKRFYRDECSEYMFAYRSQDKKEGFDILKIDYQKVTQNTPRLTAKLFLRDTGTFEGREELVRTFLIEKLEVCQNMTFLISQHNTSENYFSASARAYWICDVPNARTLAPENRKIRRLTKIDFSYGALSNTARLAYEEQLGKRATYYSIHFRLGVGINPYKPRNSTQRVRYTSLILVEDRSLFVMVFDLRRRIFLKKITLFLNEIFDKLEIPNISYFHVKKRFYCFEADTVLMELGAIQSSTGVGGSSSHPNFLVEISHLFDPESREVGFTEIRGNAVFEDFDEENFSVLESSQTMVRLTLIDKYNLLRRVYEVSKMNLDRFQAVTNFFLAKKMDENLVFLVDYSNLYLLDLGSKELIGQKKYGLFFDTGQQGYVHDSFENLFFVGAESFPFIEIYRTTERGGFVPEKVIDLKNDYLELEKEPGQTQEIQGYQAKALLARGLKDGGVALVLITSFDRTTYDIRLLGLNEELEIEKNVHHRATISPRHVELEPLMVVRPENVVELYIQQINTREVQKFRCELNSSPPVLSLTGKLIDWDLARWKVLPHNENIVLLKQAVSILNEYRVSLGRFDDYNRTTMILRTVSDEISLTEGDFNKPELEVVNESEVYAGYLYSRAFIKINVFGVDGSKLHYKRIVKLDERFWDDTGVLAQYINISSLRIYRAGFVMVNVSNGIGTIFIDVESDLVRFLDRGRDQAGELVGVGAGEDEADVFNLLERTPLFGQSINIFWGDRPLVVHSVRGLRTVCFIEL